MGFQKSVCAADLGDRCARPGRVGVAYQFLVAVSCLVLVVVGGIFGDHLRRPVILADGHFGRERRRWNRWVLSDGKRRVAGPHGRPQRSQSAAPARPSRWIFPTGG
ncbi:MAG: hypothetical protein M3186_07515 [Actinomycetota bacterium]|nr:hypothetical protein [Actinomycetota bacterium]